MEIDGNQLEIDGNQLEIDGNQLETYHNQLETYFNQLETYHNQLETYHNQLEIYHNQLEIYHNRLEIDYDKLEIYYKLAVINILLQEFGLSEHSFETTDFLPRTNNVTINDTGTLTYAKLINTFEYVLRTIKRLYDAYFSSPIIIHIGENTNPNEIARLINNLEQYTQSTGKTDDLPQPSTRISTYVQIRKSTLTGDDTEKAKYIPLAEQVMCETLHAPVVYHPRHSVLETLNKEHSNSKFVKDTCENYTKLKAQKKLKLFHEVLASNPELHKDSVEFTINFLA